MCIYVPELSITYVAENDILHYLATLCIVKQNIYSVFLSCRNTYYLNSRTNMTKRDINIF